MQLAQPELQKLFASWCQGSALLAAASGWPANESRFHLSCVTRHAADLRRLRALVLADKQPEAYRLQDHILHSYSGRYCAFIDAISLAKVGKIKPITVEELDTCVRSVRPDKRIFGSATLMRRRKANGKTRQIVSPGWKFRTAQLLASRTLACWGVENPFDHNAPGRGTHTAIKEITRLIEEDGVNSFVLFDIANFFSSVRPSHLKGRLPLPNRVIQHAMFFNRRAILVHTDKMDMSEVEAARQCLPAGARLSGITASSLLGWILHDLSGAQGLVTFVDDGVIGACDPAGANALAEAFKSRLSQHPGGPLYLKHLNVVSAQGGFAFLGYWIRVQTNAETGTEKVVVQPSHAAKVKMKRSLFRKLRVLGKTAGYDALVARADAYRKSWLSSFPLWRPSEEDLNLLDFEVLTYVGDFLDGFAGKASLLKFKPLPPVI